MINLTQPKRRPSWLSPWGAYPQNWRRSFLRGRKPKKKEYWFFSFMNKPDGWGWHTTWYKFDMEDYLKEES